MLRHWRLLVAYTAIEVAIPWALLAQAETKLTSSLTGLLIAAVPLVGALAVMYTGGRERHDRASGSGLLIGLLGVAALVGLDFGQLDVLALIEVAFVAICYAIRPIMLARSLGGVSALGVVAASLLITTLVYAPLAATHLPDRRTPSNRCSASRSSAP